MRISFILRLFAPTLLLAPLVFAPPAAAGQQDVAYGPDPQEQLDVCTPSAPAAHAPAVLMIHGGGWKNGSRHGLGGPCRMLAQQGIVAFDMDYRLLNQDPGTKWPVQINDAQLAMRWVRAHAAAYGVNPSHICSEGDSAGGHLALLLDVLNTIHAGDRANTLAGISPRADCVIAISGLSDLVAIDSTHPGAANFLIGNTDPAYLHQQKADGSPALQVHAGAGPALLIHGLQDPLVPFVQAREMQDAFARAGTPAWLITHQGGHEFNGVTAAQGHALWALIGNFVRSERLAGPPRQIPVKEIAP